MINTILAPVMYPEILKWGGGGGLINGSKTFGPILP